MIMIKLKANRIFRNLLILILLATNVGCDQISKSIVRQKIAYNEEISLIKDFVTLTKVENTGAFLGLGNQMPRIAYKILMIILPLIVIGFALYYLFKKQTLPNLFILGIGLIAGGGLGNIYDRIIYGSVTDFLHFDFGLFQTGIVNLADISVTAGCFILIYERSINRKRLKPTILE
jgi:signal peptidase II